MTYTEIENKLESLGFCKTLLNEYHEPHRFYHDIIHIRKMIDSAEEKGILSDNLFLAIVFHDIVYNPKKDNNEKLSAKLFKWYCKNKSIDANSVERAILDTKTHQPKSKLSEQLCELDLEILYGSFEDFMDYDEKIFKEYQWVNYDTYVQKRIEVLERYKVSFDKIQYVACRTPKIAVYPGSFNPFHVGHYNILQKAEKIFDKVIIALGNNPDKKRTEKFKLSSKLQFREIVEYNGMLTDFLKSEGLRCFNSDITVIRGMRNSNDFEYEMTQYRYLQEFMPWIQVVSIFADKDYEHVSSSAIQKLDKMGQEHKYTLL